MDFEARVSRVQSVAPDIARVLSEEPQQYSDLPPGKGCAIVYVGVCLVNGKRYVGRHVHGIAGRTVRRQRWNCHASGSSGCKAISNAIQFHGPHNFDWFVLEHVPEDEIELTEGEWIHQFRAMDKVVGYNLKAPAGYDCTSEETRERMSLSAKARLETPEARAAWSRTTKVIQNRPDQKEKLRRAKLSKREIELSACATEADREKLMELFAKRDAFNAQVRARKERGEVRVKRGTPEWFAKQKANRAKKCSM